MSTAQTWAILVTWLITFAIAIAAGVWSIAGFRDLTPKRKPGRRARDVADPRMSPSDFAAKIDEFRDDLIDSRPMRAEDATSAMTPLAVNTATVSKVVVEPDGSGVKLREVSRQFYARPEHEATATATGADGSLVDLQSIRPRKARINNEMLSGFVRNHLQSAVVHASHDLELSRVGENIDDPLVEASNRDIERDGLAVLDDLIVPSGADLVSCGRERAGEIDVHESSSSVGDGRGRAPRMVGTSEPTEEEL